MELLPGGFAIVEPYGLSNILALVGGGKLPKFPPNKLLLWDNSEGRIVAEIELSVDIRAVKLRRERSRSKGQIETVELPTDSIRSLTHDRRPRATPATGLIAAHASQIGCIAISKQGSMVATASERGTLIRVFDRRTGTLTNELRRGADYAEIYSLSFNTASTRICVASDKGTVHIFNLGGEGEQQ
eukprot:jgi/Hompol1/3952/HPOL_003412-RA